jgi:hypothetical protein
MNKKYIPTDRDAISEYGGRFDVGDGFIPFSPFHMHMRPSMSSAVVMLSFDIARELPGMNCNCKEV